MTAPRVKAKDLATQTFTFPAGQSHQIVVLPRVLSVLDVEDAHFNLDRRVLLPDLSSTDGSEPVLDVRRITGLGVIFAALAHSKRHPDQGVCVTGHTDPSGRASHNQTLSEDRARNVSLLLRGKRELWRQHAAAKDNVDDFQTILTWQHERSDWGCDPGPINNVNGLKTREAIGTFQERYNQEVDLQAGKDTPFRAKISVDSKVGPQTWGAFFDLYMTELVDLLDLDGVTPLEMLQAALKAPPGMQDFVGCGEHIPFSAARRNPLEKGTDEHRDGPQKFPSDRRVEILFFDPGEEVNQVCHPRPGRCVPAECPLYTRDPFTQNPIGIPKGLAVAEINLQLVFRDPEGQLRPFPEGLEVRATFGDPTAAAGADANTDLLDPAADDDDASKGAGGDRDPASMAVDQEPTEKTTADGGLRFVIPRKGRSLFLTITAGDKHFITADPKRLDDQRLATEAEAVADVDKGRVFYRIPTSFTTQEGYFKVLDDPSVKFEEGQFREIHNRQTQIGSRERPVKLALEIRWQFFKLVYFDRFTLSATTVPQARPAGASGAAVAPLVMQGFPFLGDPTADPQFPIARTAWHLTTGKDTVHCLAWLQRIIRADAPPRSLPDRQCLARFRFADPVFVRTDGDGRSPDAERRLVSFATGDHTARTPSADRLRLYDLPVDWWSTDYPVRLEGEALDRIRPFPQAATTSSTLARPYVVSLDTIVLESSIAPKPDTDVVWDDAKIEHRFAIYDHQLQVYQPESALGEGYFTRLGNLARQPDGPVLHDVAPFTRLITRGRSLYTVFDQRTRRLASFKGAPIGARLAAQCRVPIAGGRTQTVDPFSAIVAPYQAPRQNTSSIGESACAVLRCCGRDGNVERFFVIQYLTASFNFAPPPIKGRTALTTPPTGSQATQQAVDCLNKARKRWNGQDDSHRDQVTFRVGAPAPARGRWLLLLARGAPGGSNAAILDIRVFDDSSRAAMHGPEGRWAHKNLDLEGRGRFTAAHELGHSLGLPDEYLDADDEPSLGLPNLREHGRGAGTPYSTDSAAMMMSNIEVRTRYFWHLVLFWRAQGVLTETHDISIEHGRHKFRAALTTPERDPVHVPTVSRTSAQIAAVSPLAACDLFVYASGHDGFFDGAIDDTAPAAPFDGLIKVQVKMAWTVNTTSDYDELKALLDRTTSAIESAFNQKHKLVVRGVLGGTAVRLRVYFSLRFVMRTFPSGGDTATYLDSIDFPPLVTKDRHGYEDRAQLSVTSFGTHAEITVVAGGTPGVVAGTVPRRAVVRQDESFLLIFTRSHFTDDVLRMFGQLVGLPGGKLSHADDFKALFDTLAPDLTVTHRDFLR